MVTVFGGTGFLGREIVSQLLQAGVRVRVAARHPERAVFEESEQKPDLMTVDIRDENAVRQAVAGATGVVNAVSLYVEKHGLSFEDIHVVAARRIARCAQEAGVGTLVHISGIGVDEHSASAYIRARTQGEQAVREIFEGAIVLRPSVLFGPGDSFLTTLASLARLPIIPLFGRGQTRLQPVHVADVASAAAQFLTRPPEPGLHQAEVFELGGVGIYTYRDLLELVLAHLGKRRPLLPVPFAGWRALAAVASALPNPPLTSDQVALMEQDNVVRSDAAGFAQLGIKPADIAATLPQVLRTGRLT